MMTSILQRVEDGAVFGEKSFLPQVHDQDHPGHLGVAFDRQFEKLGQEGDRHIVNTVKTGIFKCRHSGAFAGARQAGNNDDG